VGRITDPPRAGGWEPGIRTMMIDDVVERPPGLRRRARGNFLNDLADAHTRPWEVARMILSALCAEED